MAGTPWRHRPVEKETVSEKVRRCDAAAELCERLARRMEWQLNPEVQGGNGYVWK